ncbi:MAG: M23 family metallopeptidase [Candidatus Syntrophonatronum acetioxidans]|uniref:M23 family metallopeptidase n=1 Tax=Candidatus Syntrophonatronum acetioxidans TaxID=1795816 RepID=A0A424YFW3_9FIRM|nr:MAG: M23 family metallopeptidase [Candidatus Syntrophonatronum acetioxidans]
MKEKLEIIREMWEKALGRLENITKIFPFSPRQAPKQQEHLKALTPPKTLKSAGPLQKQRPGRGVKGVKKVTSLPPAREKRNNPSRDREQEKAKETKKRHLRILGAYLLLLVVIMTGFVLGQGQREEGFFSPSGDMQALGEEEGPREQGVEEKPPIELEASGKTREVVLSPGEDKGEEEREEGPKAAPAREEFKWPLQGEITAEFHQVYQVGSQYRLHQGIDLKAPRGASVQASLSGQVEKVTRDPALGEIVVLSHPGNFQTLYGNLDQARVEEGQQVKKGEKIALVGETALLDASRDSFLHFEVREGDIPRDPLEYLPW